MAPSASTSLPPAPERPRRRRRALLWGALLALLGVAQTLLVALTISYESTRAQEEADSAAAEAAADLKRELLRAMQQLQALAWPQRTREQVRDELLALMRTRQDLRRVEWRDEALAVGEVRDTPYGPPLFAHLARDALQIEAELACNAARRAAAPIFSRSYFVPLPGGLGLEVLDLCLPVQRAAGAQGPGSPGVGGFVVASFALAPLLEAALPARAARRHEYSFVEGDGTRLARAGVPRGAGVYVAERIVDLPGASLQLRADAGTGRPSLIPNLTLALVLGLSLALFSVVWVLARDVRRRAQAERALAEALAFRQAMENSLPTGLRARDLAGMVTYVNPAFCAMVGFTPEELRVPPPGPPPYWPPEFAPQYERRQRERLFGPAVPGADRRDAREGYETVFMRKNGERFPVMIYEAPLVDGQGRHTGWMGAVVDLGAQRRVEELSRQQQDRLQATARLATVGEMASLLSHELNQPLAAIASYASGSLNLLDTVPGDAPPDPALREMLHGALGRIAEQAERAGRVIKSVHDFVRRREQLHEAIDVQALLEAVLPLARMQARKSGTRIEIDLPPPAAGLPRVRCDRTMVEQVLLNLARNAIQAMEAGTAAAERVLTLRVRQTHERWVTFAVVDAGPGIPAEVAQRLFTPFFTTKTEGMGLGLSLCRTVIEQHGGALDYGPGPGGRGTEFRFTLPAAAQRAAVPAAATTSDD
jgi:two-component system sensor histidine kinase DctS